MIKHGVFFGIKLSVVIISFRNWYWTWNLPACPFHVVIYHSSILHISFFLLVIHPYFLIFFLVFFYFLNIGGRWTRGWIFWSKQWRFVPWSGFLIFTNNFNIICYLHIKVLDKSYELIFWGKMKLFSNNMMRKTSAEGSMMLWMFLWLWILSPRIKKKYNGRVFLVPVWVISKN